MADANTTSRQKRILMVAPQPIFEPRGTPFSVVYRIRALCRAGHLVDLVTYPYGRDPKIDGLTIYRVPKLPGVSGVRIGPSLPKLFLDAMMAVRVCMRLVRRRYDCVWSHEEAGLFCGIVSRLIGLPHIYDMHSDLAQQIKNFKKFDLSFLVWFFDAWERVTIRCSDVVLTICDDLVDRVRSIAPEKRLILAENYCTEVDFLDDEVPAIDTLRQRHNIGEDTVALYLGSLEPYQGIDILIGAAEHLSRAKSACRMLIVGGRDAQVQELRREVDSRGLTAIVEVVGSVSPPVVDAYVRMCDILLTARSRGTNVPLKLYSYMKSGKPIVATNIYSHTQLLDDRNCLLVEPNGDAFGAGIEKLVSDPSLRERISSAASAKAVAFSNEVFERNILQALEWALGPKLGVA